MARRSGSRNRLRLAGALLLLASIAGGWGWWDWRHWQPPREVYAVQGVEIGAGDGTVDWKAMKAIGADFAYIDATAGAFARDPSFVRNLELAAKAGLQTGAVHRFDPCQPADRQAANFVTLAPRDGAMLPPAVELDQLADDCPVAVPDAAVESELMTFLNQIETHTGKAAILKISSSFESRYRLAKGINRNLWLARDRFQPDYAGRPWTMWTANSALMNPAEPEPLRWVVVQP